MNIFRVLAFIIAATFAVQPVLAQYQVPKYSTPIGRGGGVTGFGSAAPGAQGNVLTSTGPNSDPAYTAPRIAPGGAVSPLSYGVICDGVAHTGNAASFQNALNAAIAAFVPLQLPAANCVLEATITNGTGLFTNTTIIGYGSPASAVTFTGSAGFAFNAQAAIYHLTNFLLFCQSASTNPCLKIFHATQSTATSTLISGLYIQNSGAYGMYFQNMSQAQILNNVIITNQVNAVGLYVDNTASADAGGNLVQGNEIVATPTAGVQGIYYLNVGGTRSLNNAIDNYTYGIFNQLTINAGASTGIQQSDNIIDDMSVAGIWITGNGAGGLYANMQINNNHIRGKTSGSDGIVFTTGSAAAFVLGATITGNYINTLSGAGGIVVKGINGFTISGNTIGDQGTTVSAAISTILPGTANCIIMGNAVFQYTSHLSNAVPCAVSGATN